MSTKPAGAATQPASSSPDQTFDLFWWTVDSGGGRSEGGAFSLDASIGQPDATLLSGCSFALSGGLLSGIEDFQAIFCDGFESGDLGAWDPSAEERP